MTDLPVTVTPLPQNDGVPALETPVDDPTRRQPPGPEPEPRLTFSASRLKTWMECSMKAHLHYDQRLPQRQSGKASFGTIIHACLEFYNNTGNLKAAVDMFDDLWHNPEKLGVAPDYWPKMTTWEGLRQRGRAILRQVDEQLNWDKREVLATEHPFKVPFGRYYLNGFVDLVEFRRSGNGNTLLRIVDYKTASRRPTQAALYLDIQFTVYLYASLQPEFWTGLPGEPDYPGMANGEWLYETARDVPRRAIWYHLWDAKEIDAGRRDLNDFRQLYRVCEQVDLANRTGIHIPHIGEACTFCDYHEPCGVDIPTPEQVRAQPDAWI